MPIWADDHRAAGRLEQRAGGTDRLKHTFTITFAGEGESQAILGKVDAASGQMSGTLSARWHTRRYGLCSTGHVSWTAQRRASPPATAAIATVGRYSGWTNQSGRISFDVATGGRQLTALAFSAVYRCPGRHSVHLSESFPRR